LKRTVISPGAASRLIGAASALRNALSSKVHWLVGFAVVVGLLVHDLDAAARERSAAVSIRGRQPRGFISGLRQAAFRR